MSDPAAALHACVARLDAALTDPAAMRDADLQTVLAAAVRLYAARAEFADIAPFPPPHDITANEVMIAVTEMLRAVNVQVFELSMWQTMCGMGGLQPRREEIPG